MPLLDASGSFNHYSPELQVNDALACAITIPFVKALLYMVISNDQLNTMYTMTGWSFREVTLPAVEYDFSGDVVGFSATVAAIIFFMNSNPMARSRRPSLATLVMLMAALLYHIYAHSARMVAGVFAVVMPNVVHGNAGLLDAAGSFWLLSMLWAAIIGMEPRLRLCFNDPRAKMPPDLARSTWWTLGVYGCVFALHALAEFARICTRIASLSMSSSGRTASEEERRFINPLELGADVVSLTLAVWLIRWALALRRESEGCDRERRDRERRESERRDRERRIGEHRENERHDSGGRRNDEHRDSERRDSDSDAALDDSDAGYDDSDYDDYIAEQYAAKAHADAAVAVHVVLFTFVAAIFKLIIQPDVTFVLVSETGSGSVSAAATAAQESMRTFNGQSVAVLAVMSAHSMWVAWQMWTHLGRIPLRE